MNYMDPTIISLDALDDFSEDDVVDQNADNPPAGTPGHPGIDEDTA